MKEISAPDESYRVRENGDTSFQSEDRRYSLNIPEVAPIEEATDETGDQERFLNSTENSSPQTSTSKKSRARVSYLLRKLRSKETQLYKAIASRDAEEVTLLLKAGASTATSADWGTPVHHAASLDFHIIMAAFLSNGADIDARNWSGESPLHLACWEGFVQTVQALLAVGADIEAQDISGSTPLFKAALGRHPDCIQLLIQSKSNVQAKDHRGKTALHRAFSSAIHPRTKDCVETLLKNGADVNAKNNYGQTPLHLIPLHPPIDPDLKREILKCVQLLVQYGADANAADINGRTPLQELWKRMKDRKAEHLSVVTVCYYLLLRHSGQNKPWRAAPV
ncbi:MAG: hypothetical protein Q9218_003102 [Villophora microphyllina]